MASFTMTEAACANASGRCPRSAGRSARHTPAGHAVRAGGPLAHPPPALGVAPPAPPPPAAPLPPRGRPSPPPPRTPPPSGHPPPGGGPPPRQHRPRHRRDGAEELV